jgi:hypothetical protein
MNLFKVVPAFIATVFVIVLLSWGLLGLLITKGCKAIQQGDGLKGVTAQMWNGTNSPSHVTK